MPGHELLRETDQVEIYLSYTPVKIDSFLRRRKQTFVFQVCLFNRNLEGKLFRNLLRNRFFFSSIQTFKIELHSKKDTCYHLDQAFSYKIYRAKFIIVSGRKIFCAVTWRRNIQKKNGQQNYRFLSSIQVIRSIKRV